MKTTSLLGGVLVFLFFGWVSLRADSFYQMPKWVAYYNDAAFYYQIGACRVSDAPAEAITWLTKARQLDQQALAAGGGQYAVILSDLIRKAMQQANSNLAKPSTKPKPTHRPVVRNNTPPIKISHGGTPMVIKR